jgi:nicotinamidase-related amidase
MKPALLVIDLQNDCVRDENRVSIRSAIAVINQAMPEFRKRGFPVVVIQHADANLVPGTSSYDLIDGLKVEPADIRVQKTYMNGFNKTNLEEVLKAAGADYLVISGYCAEYCVLGTMRGADDRDYRYALLSGGVASASERNMAGVFDSHDSLSMGPLVALLEAARREVR